MNRIETSEIINTTYPLGLHILVFNQRLGPVSQTQGTKQTEVRFFPE